MCTIVTQWGKYEYQKLPMGLCTSVDVFQEKMSELMAGIDTVRTYLDDLLHITKSSFDEHLTILDKVFSRIEQAGLKINTKKSMFAVTELEYLGYFITCNGVKPLANKVSAIQSIQSPKTRKQLRSFIGMINYYCDMWQHRSKLLQPLTALTSKNVPYKWTDIHQSVSL